MITLALLALVASVMVWASPSSQAQANEAPFADAGPDQTVNPGASVILTGAGSIDVDAGTAGDCGGCTYEWEIETGPYDYLRIGEASGTPADDTATPGAAFEVPSEAFVDKVADSDPHKYEIVVRLTVTDDDGATDSDTVSININQRPVADIQVYAGLRDKTITDGDLGAHGHFPTDAVIDGPGENGNRDNEWDIMEGAYLQLSGSGSTDENPSTGKPATYWWTRPQLRGAAAGDGYNLDTAQTSPGTAAQQRLNVAVDNEETGDDSNVVVIDFGDLDGDGNPNEAEDATATPRQIAETISVATLPDVQPNKPVTVFYQLNVCDAVNEAGDACTGRTGAALIRLVVHDTSAAPEVEIGASLTTASKSRGDAKPQSTVSQFTGVENQFIVDAGSTVLLTATVEDDDQASGHVHRWSGATAVPDTATATVRVPADAEDGDTIDGSVTTIDATRISVTTTFQLLVGENTPPTAGGVPANGPTIDSLPAPAPHIHITTYSDGVQNPKDGATVTLRGVGNDADGDSIITAWALREAPNQAAIETAVTAWLAAPTDTTLAGAAVGAVGGALANLEEPDKPLIELNGALTDTVSFDVPELATGTSKSTFLLFNVIDSKGVSAQQFIYLRITGDDDAPNADAGDDQQVDPKAFVRLNGSASSDPDVGDKITYSWEYTGATMDPLPDDRSPLSSAEIDELDGWILDKDATAAGGFTYIVNSAGVLNGTSDKLKSTTSAYPYFDAPDLSGFNNLKLNFRLHVKDTPGTDLDGDGATANASVASLDENNLNMDLNGDGDIALAADGTGPAAGNDTVTSVNEADLGLDLNNDGDAQDTIDLGASTCGADSDASCAANEANVAQVDSDTVTITVVNRFFSGNIPGPDYCTGKSLGGPQTSAFDSDGDGVADTCSLSTTRRATVARQNALETLATLNPVEFRDAVNGVCGASGFKQRNYGDDPADLGSDVCETGRVTPPPAEVDAADADEFYSGAITGPDYCTNHSLGGARTYAFDSDGDGVADVCSLPTTRREAIARQRALETFIETFSAAEQTQLTGLKRLIELSDGITAGTVTNAASGLTEYGELYNTHVNSAVNGHTTALTAAEKTAAETSIAGLESKSANATRYSNALAAACRALGSQDFGDSASSLARDACAPRSGPTGKPLS